MLWWQSMQVNLALLKTLFSEPEQHCQFRIAHLLGPWWTRSAKTRFLTPLIRTISVENAKASNKTHVFQLIVSMTNLVVYFSRQWKGDPVQKNCQRVSWISLAQWLYLMFQLFHTNSNTCQQMSTTLTTFDKKVTDPTSPTFRLEHFWGLK